jgi:hypothetical protein
MAVGADSLAALDRVRVFHVAEPRQRGWTANRLPTLPSPSQMPWESFTRVRRGNLT